MPTYRVTYEHIGSKADITVEVPTDAAAGDQRQLEDAIARRVGERRLDGREGLGEAHLVCLHRCHFWCGYCVQHGFL